MPTAKAISSDSQGVDTSTSGNNAKASASDGEYISTSHTKTANNGNTITEKVFGKKSNESSTEESDSNSSSVFEWVTGSNKTEKGATATAKKRDVEDEDEDDEDGADATTKKDGTAMASAGKGAKAGIVNGKPVATVS